MIRDLRDTPEKRMTGIKRIRLLAAVIAAVMFGITAAQQFWADPEIAEFPLFGVIFIGMMGIIGFALIYGVMTVVIFILRAMGKGD